MRVPTPVEHQRETQRKAETRACTQKTRGQGRHPQQCRSGVHRRHRRPPVNGHRFHRGTFTTHPNPRSQPAHTTGRREAQNPKSSRPREPKPRRREPPRPPSHDPPPAALPHLPRRWQLQVRRQAKFHTGHTRPNHRATSTDKAQPPPPPLRASHAHGRRHRGLATAMRARGRRRQATCLGRRRGRGVGSGGARGSISLPPPSLQGVREAPRPCSGSGEAKVAAAARICCPSRPSRAT